jgi:peptidoglycan/LPS O-acetylase OafA/YrhL
MKYRAEIDGLRALAVLPVILYHAGFSLFSGGYVGVDIFFVISGYLITTILINDIDAGRFSIIDFYERRARRIIPVLFFITILSLVSGWLLLNPLEIKNIGNALIGISTFTSNIVFWKSQGYFEASAELNPLIHTWSLAVEEQYYLIFPVFLVVAWRYGRSKVFWLIVLLSAFSLALSELGWRLSASANFYLAPTRAWELLFGSIAAFIYSGRTIKKNDWLSLTGLLAILVSIFVYDKSTPFPSLYTVLPVMGTILVILFATDDTFSSKILSNKFLVGVGLVSYSAYLWHQPLLAYFRVISGEIDIKPLSALAIIAFTFILAYFSWRLVESPFRDRSKFSRKYIFIFSAFALLVLMVFGLITRNVYNDPEYRIANSLAQSDYVYFANIDDRKFMAERLSLPLQSFSAVVMGSSRMMQVRSDMLDQSALNLSVSGASFEDDIALVGESVAVLKPKLVIIGLDPWLLNKNRQQSRWKSSEELYLYWENKISSLGDSRNDLVPFLKSKEINDDVDVKIIDFIYDFVGKNNSFIAESGESGIYNKRAYDGHLIYNKSYIVKTESDISNEFPSLMKYSMKSFELDVRALSLIKDLVHWLKKQNIEAVLVLPPYHPDLYKLMAKSNHKAKLIEHIFREMANDLDVPLLGSYSPVLANCMENEFYDGMHPKESCMRKVLLPLAGGNFN